MPEEKTDEDIITDYINGETEAYKILIDRYASSLYNFTARITNRNDAPDIVQETFIKAWKSLARFDSGKASFKTWIFTIARNSATDFLRKKKSLLFSDLDKNNDDDINSFAENIETQELLPDAVLEKLEDNQVLNTNLENLRIEYRQVLTLRYQEDMTFEEIGKILNKSLNTVKSQHRRALIELRKMLT